MDNRSRNTKSAGSIVVGQNSPFNRPQTSSYILDKSAILWKDFLNGVKRRRALVARLKETAMETAAAGPMLKRMLFEVRQTTLTIIEDALEIEYRFQIFDPRVQSTSVAGKGRNNGKTIKLPPITNFRSMEEKEDVYALAEMINDVDDLFHVPNIRVMLPKDFPGTRNPFLLGKDVDELASLTPPQPEAGNLEEEMKVLELLRYKRAARALIRAEAQVLNNLPISLYDVDRLLARMNDDPNIEKLIRSVYTLMDNDRMDVGNDAQLQCLLSPIFNVEGHDLLARLNRFRGVYPMRVDVQVAVRQMLSNCEFDYLDDVVSTFLVDWINLILSQPPPRSSSSSSRQRGEESSLGSRSGPRPLTGTGQLGAESLGTITEQPSFKSDFLDSPSRPNSRGSVLRPQSRPNSRPNSRQQTPQFGMMSSSRPNSRQGVSGAGGGVAPLTERNLREHQQYTDLTSVVSDTDRGTRESIFVEPPPLMKLKPGSPGYYKTGLLGPIHTEKAASPKNAAGAAKAYLDATAAARRTQADTVSQQQEFAQKHSLSQHSFSQSQSQAHLSRSQPDLFHSQSLSNLGQTQQHGQGQQHKPAQQRAFKPTTSTSVSFDAGVTARHQQQAEAMAMDDHHLEKGSQGSQQSLGSHEQALGGTGAGGRSRRGRGKIDPRKKLISMSTLDRIEARDQAEAKFRADVERIVEDMGLSGGVGGMGGGGGGAVRRRVPRAGGANGDEYEDTSELDRISSLRYELHRMQQELMRRQVLDPRHYQAASIDSVAQAQGGLTVGSINAEDPMESRRRKQVEQLQTTKKLVPLSERVVSTQRHRDGEHRRSIEVLLDLTAETMVGRINLAIDPSVLMVDVDSELNYLHHDAGTIAVSQQSGGSTASKRIKQQVLASTTISKLIFNRLTDYLLDELLGAKKTLPRDKLGRMLQNIMEQLETRSMEDPPLLGNFLMHANRVLYSNKFTEDGVLVDLVILRNDECNGLIIHCTPLAGIYNPGQKKDKSKAAGPVTIAVRDSELQVLLINQYGLYKLAMVQWGSMEMVAQWLSGRLIVRKIKAQDTGAREEEERQRELAAEAAAFKSATLALEGAEAAVEDNEAEEAEEGLMVMDSAKYSALTAGSLDQGSMVSQVTFDNTAKVLQIGDGDSVKETAVALKGSQLFRTGGALAVPSIDESTIGSQDSPSQSRNPSAQTGPGQKQERQLVAAGAAPSRPDSTAAKPRMLVLLDVQLDRRIEISPHVLLQWQSRNVPSIAGMDVKLEAVQDLEMLVVHATLTLPLPHKFAQLRRKEKQKAKGADFDGLDDMAEYDSDEEEDPTMGLVEPAKIELSLRLTSAELAIFGAAEMIDQKKITLSEHAKKVDEEHPETFIWNVLSRMRVKFKVNITSGTTDLHNWQSVLLNLFSVVSFLSPRKFIYFFVFFFLFMQQCTTGFQHHTV